MKRFLVLAVLFLALLAGCHEDNMVFHLITPPPPGEVEVLPTPTPEPPTPTLEPDLHPEAVCLVKGNISRTDEKIYHVEGQLNYDRVIIDPDHGERCFDTEEEAVAAGWRKAQR